MVHFMHALVSKAVTGCVACIEQIYVCNFTVLFNVLNGTYLFK